MARCMLCSSAVSSGDVVCPQCGGAVVEDPLGPDDPTRIASTPGAAAPSGPAGPAGPAIGAGDTTWIAPSPGLTSTDAGEHAPWDAPAGGPVGYGAPPAAPPGGWSAPGPDPFGAQPVGPPPQPVYGPSPYGPAPYGPPAYGPAGYGSPYGAVPFAPRPPTEGLAIGAFVTSLACLVLSFACYFPILGSPVGAILGHIALRRINETGKEGRGFALAGVIIGWIGTALLVLAIVLLVALGVGGAFNAS